MNTAQRLLARLDGYQRRHPWLGFPLAVQKKFGDDQAGYLAALIAYYGFFSLFPLLLVFVSVVGLLLTGSLREAIVNSALSNFPVVGPDISRNVHSLNGSGLALAVGIAGTLWAGLGVTLAAQNAMNRVWDVPRMDRPNFVSSRLRGLLMLAILGSITVASTVVSGFVTSVGGASLGVRIAGVALSLVLNFALYLLIYQVLTVKDLRWANVVPGAMFSGVLWTILQAVGGYYVNHQLRSASNTYGTFAIVIGLLVWLYLGAQITLYGAEINVVRARRLWPRSLAGPPLTQGDRDVMRAAAGQEQLREEQSISVAFRTPSER